MVAALEAVVDRLGDDLGLVAVDAAGGGASRSWSWFPSTMKRSPGQARRSRTNAGRATHPGRATSPRQMMVSPARTRDRHSRRRWLFMRRTSANGPSKASRAFRSPKWMSLQIHVVSGGLVMIGIGPASEPASSMSASQRSRRALDGRGGHDAAPSTRLQRATSPASSANSRNCPGAPTTW